MYSSECSGDFFGGVYSSHKSCVWTEFVQVFPGFQLVLSLRTRPGAGRGWLARREVRGQQDGGGWQGKHPFPAVASFQKIGRFVKHCNSPRFWEKVGSELIGFRKTEGEVWIRENLLIFHYQLHVVHITQQLQVSKGDLLMSIDRSATTEVDMDEETEESVEGPQRVPPQFSAPKK